MAGRPAEGGGSSAVRCVEGRDGGRRREMQRNAGLLCDGLTPANQTGDAETSNKTSVPGITASLGRYLQAAVCSSGLSCLSEGTLNENRPSHFFFYFFFLTSAGTATASVHVGHITVSYIMFYFFYGAGRCCRVNKTNSSQFYIVLKI